MGYLDQLASGLRGAAGVLSPDVQRMTMEEDQRNALLRQQQAQTFVAQLAKQVADGTLPKEAAQAAAASKGLNVPPEFFGGPSLQAQIQKAAVDKETRKNAILARPEVQQLLSSGKMEDLRAVENLMVQAGVTDALSLAKERRAEAKPVFAPRESPGYFKDGVFIETPVPQHDKKPMVGATRQIQIGEKNVTQEYQSDGTWKEIGSGPKFSKQVAPVVVTGGADRFSNVQPDGNGGYIGLNKASGRMEKIPQAEGVTPAQLSSDAIEQAAQRYAVDGTLPPNMGRGTQGYANTAKILSRAADIAKEQGNTGEEARIRQIAGRAASGALLQISKQAAQVGAFERTLQKNADLALTLSDKVDRTGAPVLNKWILAGKKSIAGDPDVAALDLAMKTVVNEYAKILSSASAGGAQTAEGEIKKIESLLSSAQTKEQVKRVIEIIRQETGNRMKSFEDEKKSLTGSMKSTPKAAGSVTQQADAILGIK